MAAQKTAATPDGEEEDDAPADENEGLVKMVKDGEVSYVHPTCVDAHKTVQWVEA